MQILHCTLGMAMSNCYILAEDKPGESGAPRADGKKQGVLIDPGDRPDFLLKECEKRGIVVTAVLLTHGHFDHMLAVPKIREATGAIVYAPEGEKALLADPDANLSGPWQGQPTTLAADVWLSDGEEFDVLGQKTQVIVTPGHTAGGCCFYMPGEGWLFSGDTLFFESYGRLDLPYAVPDAIAPSIRKLLKLPDETIVFPGHDRSTTIAHERQFNPMRG